MTFTEARMLAALNRPGPSAAKRAEAIRERMPIWTACANAAGIIDARDFALFFGQVAIESDGFATAVEYWGPTAQQARYEGRRDLGNVQAGDGFRFRGRGDIQYTGRDNYRLARTDIRRIVAPDVHVPDFEAAPDELMVMPYAALSALAYWRRREIASRARSGGVAAATKLVNGGSNHIAERRAATCRIGAAVLGHDIVSFQRAAGLQVDGFAGPKTEAAVLAALTGMPLKFYQAEPVFRPAPIERAPAAATTAATAATAAPQSLSERVAALLGRLKG